MNHLLSLFTNHGYALIFLIVLAESMGLPLPASLALVGAGAAIGGGSLHIGPVLLLALTALLTGDSVLFFLGRYTGWALLGVLCRLSINPESCIMRSAESFYKRGKAALLFAKFIPGVNTMSAPLAGSMKMRFSQFLQFDFTGAVLYVLAYTGLGFIFRDFLQRITNGFQTAEHILLEVLFVAAIVYIGYRAWIYKKNRIYKVAPRIQVQELARKLQSSDSSNVLLVDVRSHGYYDAGAERIKGSVRLEPNNLAEELKNWGTDKDIYLYCT